MQIIQNDNAVEIISSNGNDIFKVVIYNVLGATIYSWKGEGRSNLVIDRKYLNSSICIFHVNNYPYKKLIRW